MTLVSRRFVLLFIQLTVLTLAVVSIGFLYKKYVLPDQITKLNFQVTNCQILSKKLSTSPGMVEEYRADYLISYIVGAIQYNRWVAANGLDDSYDLEKERQDELYNRFKVGATYNCWYDPKNPEIAILVSRHNWLGILPILIPLTIVIVVLYGIFRNLSYIFRFTAVRPIKFRKSKSKKTTKKSK